MRPAFKFRSYSGRYSGCYYLNIIGFIELSFLSQKMSRIEN